MDFSWIARQIEWLKSFLSDTYENGIAGKASSQRLFETAIVIAFLIAYLKVTIALIIAPGIAPLTLLDIPSVWAMTLIGILGIKTYSKKKSDDNETAVRMSSTPDSEPTEEKPVKPK